MKLKLLLICSAFLHSGMGMNARPTATKNQESAATMILNGGRLGDCLSLYWRAKYFCKCYNMDFYCPKFRYSDQLALDKIEKKFFAGLRRKFKRVVTLKDDRRPIQNNSTLYQLDFYFKSKHGSGDNDSQFVATMKELIKPIHPIQKINETPGRLNVAVHIRRGSGWDGSLAHCQKRWPTKFPPDSFYFEALKKLMELTDNQPVHLHIFTDAKNPESIANIFKKEFGEDDYDIKYSFRHHNATAYKDHVITDFFSMTQFDYFIRSGSGFARIIQKIGDHKIVIYPSNPVWHAGVLKIKKLGIIDKRNSN